MHAADPTTSPRLQRALAVLSDRKEHSTRGLVRDAGICAVNSVIAELRQAGYQIQCSQRVIRGKRRFFYQLTRAPEDA